MTKEEKLNDYEGFVEKFKPKRTTDDCYTPPAVYDAVRDWACQKYSIDPDSIVRPFWPGGDYEAFDYPAGCTVLDNPPFSILAKIVRFYEARRIPYFLFAPGLTALGLARHGAGILFTETTIVYMNGARIKAAFATSFGENAAEIVPDLGESIRAAQLSDVRTPQLIYQYPANLLTTQGALALARHKVPYAVPRTEAAFVRALDEMKAEGKRAFGGALLISDRAAECKTEAEKDFSRLPADRTWHLSDREREIIETLNKGPAGRD